MAEVSYNADVTQGFNFEKDRQTIVGHINYLKIGDQELKSDLNVSNPEDSSQLVKIFGVASYIFWGGGYAEPIQYSCQVSTANRVALATLTHVKLENTEIDLQFTFYDFDPVEKQYFQCFHTDGQKVKGLVEKSGGELNMMIDADQSMEVVSPKNFTFQMGVMPQEQDMALHIAMSMPQKIAKKWGVEVAA